MKFEVSIEVAVLLLIFAEKIIGVEWQKYRNIVNIVVFIRKHIIKKT